MTRDTEKRGGGFLSEQSFHTVINHSMANMHLLFLHLGITSLFFATHWVSLTHAYHNSSPSKRFFLQQVNLSNKKGKGRRERARERERGVVGDCYTDTLTPRKKNLPKSFAPYGWLWEWDRPYSHIREFVTSRATEQRMEQRVSSIPADLPALCPRAFPAGSSLGFSFYLLDEVNFGHGWTHTLQLRWPEDSRLTLGGLFTPVHNSVQSSESCCCCCLFVFPNDLSHFKLHHCL